MSLAHFSLVPPTMSAIVNGTVPFSDAWSGYLAQAQTHPLRALLLVLVNVPFLVIVLNVLQQLVRICLLFSRVDLGLN